MDNQYQKQQSEKILKTYGISNDAHEDLEKGRKSAPIGTISKNGLQIKTAEGWDFIKKQDKVQSTPTEHVIEAPKVEKPKDVTEVNIDLKNNLSKYLDFDNPILDEILNEVAPRLNAIIEHYEKSAQEKGQTFTKTDKEYLELDYLYKLMSSVGGYLTKTDKISGMRFSTSAKGFEIRATIERDGKLYNFETDAIVAGGHTIQIAHYRYITKTDLPSTFNRPAAIIEARVKYLKAVDKAEAKVKGYESDIKRLEERILGIQTTGKEEYNLSIFVKNLKGVKKKLELAKIDLEEQKVADYKAENPQEGDVQVRRDKGSYTGGNNIHVYHFVNGDWKWGMSTSTRNMAKNGFHNYMDADIEKYFRHKLAEKKTNNK